MSKTPNCALCGANNSTEGTAQNYDGTDSAVHLCVACWNRMATRCARCARPVNEPTEIWSIDGDGPFYLCKACGNDAMYPLGR